ncbi:hypothetical protein DICPUDRAFT_45887 [Dictyostelium purpureum]|uniref:Chitin-binding type-4 domain-containing protein n=1 Tax=Dictyostelium purpureum TaxID=5786 RepID=F0ZCG5_DICPU|nr:uncharacterized protein DICPUDRAFT_45887 [Dictyostelium purpureum]EGC38340.1 hypothetical protein DICPUDRAFT_45887 [Dictyostelium purpureum]|eukprot:XP_003285097.1 hypothetical protein DICPUDRAFT_45887 [Dictyostelium purpureum]
MKILYFLVILFLFNILKIQAHSFMSCVNWDFGSKSCQAYPRNYKFHVDQGDGFLFQRGKFTKPHPTELGQACGPVQRRTNPISLQYSQKYPMGQFQPGQTICPQWPARNHANQLRAGTVSFYLSNKMSSSDMVDNDQSVFFNNPVHSSAFGNCSKYYENTNNSTCTSCFKLPNNVQSGLYVLQFFWEFNPKEYYLTCADIIIGGANAAYSQNYQQQSYPQQQQHQSYPQQQQHQSYPQQQQHQSYPQQQPHQSYPQQHQQSPQQVPREHINDAREYNSQRVQEERITQQRLDQEREQEYKKREPEVDLVSKLNQTPLGMNIQYIVNKGVLEKEFIDISKGVKTSKAVNHYETQPIPGEALFFKCSSGTNCISGKGKQTINLKVNSYKSILEDTDVSLLIANDKYVRSTSLSRYVQNYVDGQSAMIRIPLSEFGAHDFMAVAITGYDELNDDYIEVESISVSN